MGTFFKQIYRYTHPRPFRHNENLWPHVKIARAATGEIVSLTWKSRAVPLVQLTDLKGEYSGDVLLTATGPSVNNILFEKFPPMPAMGVNGAYFLHDRVDFRLYLVVDMGFIDQRPDIIQNIIGDGKMIFFTTVHGIVRILNTFSASQILCRFAVVEDAACKVYQPQIAPTAFVEHYQNYPSVTFCAENKTIAFNDDIRSGIFDAGTVVYWALQVLSFLGFSKIFITGLDMNNFHKPRFYENENEKLPSFLEDKLNDLVIPSFRHASQLMKKKNIKIINLSISSAIDGSIFEKVSCDEIFK